MSVSYEQVSLFTQIPDYATLQTLVVEYLNREDDSTINMVPLFINNAEKRILRNFRIPAMEVTKTLKWSDYANDTGALEGWIYIPEDYLEMVEMWEEGSQQMINRLSFSSLMRLPTTPDVSGNAPGTADPAYPDGGSSSCNSGEYIAYQYRLGAYGGYARNGKRWYFRPIPAPDTILWMTYYQDPLELSETGESSYLLELAPDAILYMAVAEGHRFLMEEDKATYWERVSIERIDAIQLQADEAEYSGGIMQIQQPV